MTCSQADRVVSSLVKTQPLEKAIERTFQPWWSSPQRLHTPFLKTAQYKYTHRSRSFRACLLLCTAFIKCTHVSVIPLNPLMGPNGDLLYPGSHPEHHPSSHSPNYTGLERAFRRQEQSHYNGYYMYNVYEHYNQISLLI